MKLGIYLSITISFCVTFVWRNRLDNVKSLKTRSRHYNWFCRLSPSRHCSHTPEYQKLVLNSFIVCVCVYLMCLMFCVEFYVLFSVNSVETLSRHKNWFCKVSPSRYCSYTHVSEIEFLLLCTCVGSVYVYVYAVRIILRHCNWIPLPHLCLSLCSWLYVVRRK